MGHIYVVYIVHFTNSKRKWQRARNVEHNNNNGNQDRALFSSLQFVPIRNIENNASFLAYYAVLSLVECYLYAPGIINNSFPHTLAHIHRYTACVYSNVPGDVPLYCDILQRSLVICMCDINTHTHFTHTRSRADL